MVSHERDDGVVPDAQAVQFVQQLADLGVDETDRGVVSVNQLQHLPLGQFVV